MDPVEAANKKQLQLNLELDAKEKKEEFDRVSAELDDYRGKFNKAEEERKQFKDELDMAKLEKAEATELGLGPEEWEKINKRYEEAKSKFDMAETDSGMYSEMIKEREGDYERTKEESDAAETDRAAGEATNGAEELPDYAAQVEAEEAAED